MGGSNLDWGKKIFLVALFSLLLFQITPSFAQNYYHAKSENAAFALSLFGTALPLGSAILLDMDDTREESSLPFWLATGGLVIGPSLGYFYGGVGRHAWKGMAIRSSVALVTIYFVAITQDGITVQGHVSRGNQGLSSADVMFVFLGTSMVAISALTDIFSVSGHVKRRNQKLWYGDFAVLPAYFPKHQATGLQLQIVF